MSNKSVLGKGLGALISDYKTTQDDSASVRSLPIYSIEPNPYQPRQCFTDVELEELKDSIRSYGIIQPIIVRSKGTGKYEIIAGERRWRAARDLNLNSIPVIVEDIDDRRMFEIALIENLQRQALNPIEEAMAYKRMLSEHGCTQEEISKKIGKSRSHIANFLRLLTLSDKVQTAVSINEITMGHAKLLIGRDDADKLLDTIVSKKLSVRALENMLKSQAKPRKRKQTSHDHPVEPSTEFKELESMLEDLTGLEVSITHDGKAGNINFHFSSLSEIEQLFSKLNGDSMI